MALMRRLRLVLLMLLLAFVMCHTAYAGDYGDGSVVYRQSFSDVSVPDNAGVRKGERNFDGFSLNISDGALFVNCFSDTRSFAILPYFNDLDEYTIETSFSLKNISSSNAYFSLMLTSMGDAPDNVTAVNVRANGKCDGFGELDAAVAEGITAGERVYLSVPVKQGMLSSITVRVGDLTQTLRADDIKDVPYGFPGFVVRNASASVYDIAVVKGTSYAEKSGPLKESSAYTDEYPYAYFEVNTLDEPFDSDGIGTFELSPETGDMIMVYVLMVAVSALAVVFLIKKRK